jgi:hypothetical protein
MPNKPKDLPSGGAKKSTKKEGDDPATQEQPIGLPVEPGTDEVFEEDFTDTEEGFPMAEEGVHHAKVIDFEKADSKTGNPQYVWQFRIVAGNSKDIELRFWTSLLPQARWKTVETLGAIGIDAAGSVAKFKRSDIVGKPCIIDVIHDTYEGRLNHKVRKVYPPNEDTVEFAKKDETPF